MKKVKQTKFVYFDNVKKIIFRNPYYFDKYIFRFES